jgi:hypothetical protein
MLTDPQRLLSQALSERPAAMPRNGAAGGD